MGKTNGLRALEAAQLLSDGVLAAVKKFPANDPAGIRKQLSESANSVAANIAEGFGRGTKREKTHYLRIARGSLEETQNPLKVSWKAGYLDSKSFYRLWNLAVALGRMLAGLLARESR